MIPYSSRTAESEAFPIGTMWITYEQFVCNLVKEMGSLDNNIVHMALGIAGESGEIVDAIKKKGVYNKPLDRDNIIEELGDLEWYMGGLRQMLGISRHEVLRANINKLALRYSEGSYSDAAAIARADKVITGETEKSSMEFRDKGVYARIHAEHKPGQAINLPLAAVAGMDETAGILPEIVDRTDSFAPLPIAPDPV